MSHQKIKRVRITRHTLSILFFSILLCSTLHPSRAARAEDRTLFGTVDEPLTDRDEFRMVVWGDAQVKEGGPSVILNRFERAAKLTNKLDPAFTLTVGDNVAGSGAKNDFRTFVDTAETVRNPLYMVMGNHDGSGYGDYENFLWAQKELGAPEYVNYSFDAGKWHFVMFSQPAAGAGGDHHERFVDWLESDLKEHRDRPTVFLAHHPPLPVGYRMFARYNIDAANRRDLIRALTKYGNVKYALFGHVHPTVGSIPHISWRYRGCSFLVLPNPSYWSRRHAWQETTESSWGVATIDFSGRHVNDIRFHTLKDETVGIKPDEFKEYNDDVYGYLRLGSELPASGTLKNGSFEAPFRDDGTGWFRNFLLPYDRPPIQTRDRRKGDAPDGDYYLYTYTKAKKNTLDHAHRSGTWQRPLSQVTQAVRLKNRTNWPVISLDARTPADRSMVPPLTGGFVVISGWNNDARRAIFSIAYSLDDEHWNRDKPYSKESYQNRAYHHRPIFSRSRRNVALFKEPSPDDTWENLSFHVRSDYERFTDGPEWPDTDVDRLVITIGTVNYNAAGEDGTPAELEVQWDDVHCAYRIDKQGPTPGFQPGK